MAPRPDSGMLGFSALADVTANCVAVGALGAVLSASALSLDKEIERWWQGRAARATRARNA